MGYYAPDAGVFVADNVNFGVIGVFENQKSSTVTFDQALNGKFAFYDGNDHFAKIGTFGAVNCQQLAVMNAGPN